MDLAQRLNHLEAVRDWQGLAEELERGISSEADAAIKAAYHLQLGRVLEDKFLHADRALKHFQDAYKLNPALASALRQARAVYWNLGKIDMVQKQLELELKSSEPPLATELELELGDVLSDAGDYEKAAAAYARALTVSHGESEDARLCLADAQADESTWREIVDDIARQAAIDSSPEAKGRLYMRAARLSKRFSPNDLQAFLARAYEADPANKQAAALFEQMLIDEDRAQVITDVQRLVLDGLSGRARGAAAFRYGVKWATCHQKPESATKMFEEAIEYDPDHEGAFAYLRDLWGTQQCDWERVARLAATAADQSSSPFMIAQAGLVLWRHVGDPMRARAWFERLSAVVPDHPYLLAFEAQIGEKLGEKP